MFEEEAVERFEDIKGVDRSRNSILIWFDLLCLTPLSAIFQLYHGDQF
jgi:hypothetical protein